MKNENLKIAIGMLMGVIIGVLIAPGGRWSMMGEWGIDNSRMMGSDGGHMMSGNMMMGDLVALKQAADVDIEFIDQMIPHHEMAVVMGEILAERTKRPEMQKLAKDIIEAQSREINMMKTWRVEWAQ